MSVSPYVEGDPRAVAAANRYRDQRDTLQHQLDQARPAIELAAHLAHHFTYPQSMAVETLPALLARAIGIAPERVDVTVNLDRTLFLAVRAGQRERIQP